MANNPELLVLDLFSGINGHENSWKTWSSGCLVGLQDREYIDRLFYSLMNNDVELPRLICWIA